MRKIIISILAIAIIVGVYIFIQDRKIKNELSNVEESQFVDQNNSTSTASVSASQSTLTRVDGIWAVNSTQEYTIDPSSLKFEFTGYKPGGQHVGTFNKMDATLSFDEVGSPIGLVMNIDPASVKTDTAAVDKHLQASEFFDTATYPNVTVVIKEIKKEGDSIRAIADLTIKGVTKTLSVPVNVSLAGGGIKFDVDTRIKISDYNMAYGPVQDEVRVTLSGVVKKK